MTDAIVTHYHDFSSLEREAGCPASHTACSETATVSTGNEWTARGSAIDKAYQYVLAGTPVDYPALAAAYGVPEMAETIEEIVTGAPFPFPGHTVSCQETVEFDLENEHGCVLRGHPDFIIDHGGTGEVWDLKCEEDRSNSPTVDERFQIKGYGAVLAVQRGWKILRVGIFNPLAHENKRFSHVDYDLSGANAIIASLKDLVARCHGREDRVSFRAGPWCQTCNLEPTCPHLNQERTAMLALSGETLPTVPRERYPELLAVARQVKKRAEEVADIVRNTVLAEGDIQGDKLKAYKVESNRKGSLSLSKALLWLDENMYGEAAEHLRAVQADLPRTTVFQVRIKKDVTQEGA